MAGTPTTNYNIPTYADTDAPDLSGAYNDAMGIIDTQLKANADAIESASTGNYTGTAPINVDNEGRTISVTSSVPQGNGSAGPLGVTRVTGIGSNWSTATATENIVPNRKAVADYVAAHGGTAYTAGNGISISGPSISTKNVNDVSSNGGADSIADGGTVDQSWRGTVIGMISRGSDVDRMAAVNDEQHGWPGGMVASLTALKQYVETKMAAAGAAYTGTAPVVVDNGSHTISLQTNGYVGWSDSDGGSPTNMSTPPVPVVVLGSSAFFQYTQGGWSVSDYFTGSGKSPNAVPSADGVLNFVNKRTPDASTSVKGLVQLNGAGTDSTNNNQAMTALGTVNLMKKVCQTTTQKVTVQDLASNLYVSPSTGLVFWKQSS